MGTKIRTVLMLGLALLVAGVLGAQQKPDDIPDAPSATRPIPPPAQASPRPGADQDALPDVPPIDSPGPDSSSKDTLRGPGDAPHTATESTDAKPAPPPMPPIKTVPAGSVPKDMETGQDVGYTIRVNKTLVLVPVMVKNRDGLLIGGLQPKDFSVLEGGQPQKLTFFTSDPFALSAAVIFDTGMADVGLKKVQETLSALQGAFSQFDEVSVYTYSSTVGQVADFSSVGKELTAVFNEVKGFSGASDSIPITDGPLGPQGPIINGRPVDSPVTPVSTPPKVARVMNDAILRAARDLSKRPRENRKIIFVISDGREQGSAASYPGHAEGTFDAEHHGVCGGSRRRCDPIV